MIRGTREGKRAKLIEKKNTTCTRKQSAIMENQQAPQTGELIL